MAERPGIIVDVDGTLVDSTFQHALCWTQALHQHGVSVPCARVHTHIGMGADQLVAAVAGHGVEEDRGDAIRDAHGALFAALLPTIRPLEGASSMMREFADHQPVVLSSSAKADEIEHYVDLLGLRGVVRGWTTADDVDRTKPEPDLVDVAWAMLGTDRALMIGDSPWDVEAASRAGIPTVGVDTGGFGAPALHDAGAALVVGALPDLLDRVHDDPFVVWGALGRARRRATSPPGPAGS